MARVPERRPEGDGLLTADLTVLTVAWNSGESLIRWSEAWKPLGCRLVVADNGSTDGAPGSCGADVVALGRNAGYGGGINAAALQADTGLLLITNPDTVPLSGESAGILLDRFEPGTVTGAQLVDTGGAPSPSGGVWPSARWVAAQMVRRASTLWKPTRTDWIQGALMLVERELFLSGLSGFSDEFPLYFEDTDLCARAASAGHGCRLVPEARFVHAEGTGAPRSPVPRLAGYHWGLWRWFRRHRPGSAGTVRAMLVVKCVGRLASGRSGIRAGYRAALSSLVKARMPQLPEGDIPCAG
jgi:GT2 family glycosyltransferase